jgi:hypothetical protein
MSEQVNYKCSVSESIQSNPLAATKWYLYRNTHWWHIVKQSFLNVQFQTVLKMILWPILKGANKDTTIGGI